MKQLILYDLDGTLVDTLADLTAAANHMLSALAAPTLSPDEVRQHVGSGVQELVARCLKTGDPQRVARGVELYRAYYGRHLLDHSQLYPGAHAILEHFKQRRQGVVTNKPQSYSQEILEALGVSTYLRDLVAGDAGYPKKPDPSAVRALMQREGVAAADAVFIGDSPIDVETGRNAGIATVAVLHGFTGETQLRAAAPDVVVRDFSALLAVARQRAW